MRIVQLSDTHLLADGPVSTGNAERVVDFVNETLRPDLVIHTGDVIGLDPDDEGDRRAAVAACAELRAPLLVVPGNHDVGSPGERPWLGLGVTSDRLAEHQRHFGEVPWIEHFGGWGLIGLNSQLIGSGLPEEEQQWDWLGRTLAGPDTSPVVLFMHRPWWNHRPAREPDGNSVPAAARERLLALPGSKRLRALGNGHLHWYRNLRRPELLEVWGPALGFIGSTYDDTTPFRQCGVVEWRFDGEHIDTWFRAPTTLEERELRDIPEFVTRIEQLERVKAADAAE